MKKPRQTQYKDPSPIQLPALYQKWVYRILVRLNGVNKFVHKHGFSDDCLAEALGFTTEGNSSFISDIPNFLLGDSDFDHSAVRRLIKLRHKQL